MGAVKSRIKKIAEEQKKIGIQVKEKTAGYILAALGFVVALAWNDAIKTFIDYLFPLGKSNSMVAKFFYALIVTILIVVATIILTRKTEKEKIGAEK